MIALWISSAAYVFLVGFITGILRGYRLAERLRQFRQVSDEMHELAHPGIPPEEAHHK